MTNFEKLPFDHNFFEFSNLLHKIFMKKTLKISVICLGIILLIMIVLPFTLKGKIKGKIQKEINSSINAEVSFNGVGLSLFSHFPELTIKIKDLIVIGKDSFQADTLANMPSLAITIDLMSIFKGREYKVRQIVLSDPKIKLKVLANGNANWDITIPNNDTTKETEPSAFKINLDRISITNGILIYDDAEIPTMLEFAGLDGELSGDMTADITSLEIDAKAKSMIVDYDGVRYLSKAKAELKTKLDSDLSNWVFTFKNGNLRLNDLNILADGFFAMPEDGYKMDIKFSAQENTFKAFLSMIPSIYTNDFENLQASGSMSFDGFVKGLYNDISIPSFDINLKVNNGVFNYPNLPGQVSDVTVLASVSNPDGVLDHTLVNIERLHLKMINNPIDATLKIQTPISDPDIKATLKGNLNLADVSKIYPLGENTVLTGSINADISLAGKISSIEKGAYDQFRAAGYAEASKIKYSGSEVPKPVDISKARLDFSPAFIQLSDMKVIIGKNDITANGKLENYIPWFLKKNSVLKGNISTTSSFMDINSLMSSTANQPTADTIPLSIIEIPADMDILISTAFDRIIYDTYDMQNMKGSIRVMDRMLLLNGLDFNTLGGTMKLTGSYSTVNPQKPQVDMDLKISKINIQQAFRSMNTIQQLAPFASNLKGDISTNLKFKGLLKKDMMPDLSSVSAYGLVLSDLLGVTGTHALTKVAEILKIDKLKNPAIEKLNLSFDLIDGKATIKPMDFKLGSYKANFSGTTGLDQLLNLVLTLDIPRSEFGTKANGVLDGLIKDASKKGINVTLGDMIPVTVLIGGTVTNPKITTGIKSAMADMAADLKKQALEQVEKKKEELIVKAKGEAEKIIAEADARAAKIIAEAETQGQRIVDLANQASEKVRKASDSTANRVITEGNKNGPIASLAAKKTAEKIKKEGYQKADKLVSEAQQQKDAIINRSRIEAEKLKQDALNKLK